MKPHTMLLTVAAGVGLLLAGACDKNKDNAAASASRASTSEAPDVTAVVKVDRPADFPAFVSFDRNGDGELTDLEFRTALYNAWDLNGDEVIDHYEYRWN